MPRHLLGRGYSYFPDENEYLVELLIHSREDDGTEYRESLIQPTRTEIEEVCRRFGLPYDKVMEIIDGRTRDTHTIIIDVQKFLSHLREQNG